MAGVVLLAIGLGIGVAVFRSIRMPSFTINLSSQGTTAASGDNVNVTVSVERLLDYDKVVTLSASYDSAYVDNVDFSPDNWAVPFSATMTIHVRATVSGTTTITVRGTGADGVTSSAGFEFTIT